jgi:hypothetical protein
MMCLRPYLLFLLLTLRAAGAEIPTIGILLVDDLKTPRLHHQKIYELDIELPEGAAEVNVELRQHDIVRSTLEDAVTTEEVTFKGSWPRAKVEALMAGIRGIEPQRLEAEDSALPWGFTQGWVTLPGGREEGGEGYNLKARPGTPVRIALDGVLADFTRELPARRVATTVQGDHVPPRECTLEQLRADPKAFNGQRIRVRGTLVPYGKEQFLWGQDGGKALGLGEASSLVEPRMEPDLAGREVEAEGIFRLWFPERRSYDFKCGELESITSLKRVTPPAGRVDLDLETAFRSPELEYSQRESLSVYAVRDAGGAEFWLDYDRFINLLGLRRDEFRFRELRFRHRVDKAVVEDLLTRLEEVDLEGLAAPGTPHTWTTLEGEISLGRRDYAIKTDPQSRPGAALRAAIDGFLATLPPGLLRAEGFVYNPYDLDQGEHVVQGDHLPPQEVTLAQLAADPTKYDGKRVRVKGYYNFEFEICNLSNNAEDAKDSLSFWLTSSSTLVDPELSPLVNKAWVTVDATFRRGPAGHMGMSLGELERVTRMVKE